MSRSQVIFRILKSGEFIVGKNRILRRLAQYFEAILLTIILIILVGLTVLSGRATDTPFCSLRTYVRSGMFFTISAIAAITLIAIFTIYQHRNLFIADQNMHRMKIALRDHKHSTDTMIRLVFVMSEKISNKRGLAGLLDGVTGICVDLFESDRVSFMVYEKKSDDLVLCSVNGSASKDILDARIKRGEGIAGWVAQQRRPIVLNGTNDESRYPGLKLENPSIRSAMIAPIVINDELVGVINLCTHSEDILYNNNDLTAFNAIARAAGLCLVYARNHALDNPAEPRAPDFLKQQDISEDTIAEILAYGERMYRG